MSWQKIYNKENLNEKVPPLFREQRELERLDGWFLIKEIQMKYEPLFSELHPEVATAKVLEKIVELLPLSLSNHNVFAGTQNDAFAKTYALINPNFRIETFEGYCDPVAVFSDIIPNEEFTRERIDKVKTYYAATPYVAELKKVYDKAGNETKEVAYFVEQVTGHTIADFRDILRNGIQSMQTVIDGKLAQTKDTDKREVYQAMKIALQCAVILANRYADLAQSIAAYAYPIRREELLLMERTLRKVPAQGADTLFEAIQSFIILWQVMCIEQSPNPYAFSVGNVDRIFEEYRAKDQANREITAALFKRFLIFFNVGDRSWAISQNLLLGGMSSNREDLTNPMTYAVMDAYKDTNYPQPILSVKLHNNTPQQFYEEMGEFLFSTGKLTPSFFNDESIFPILQRNGVAPEDLEDYAVAGCQEPLIMGKDNGNTTNSWLNLGKILELTLNNGYSTITGEKIGLGYDELGVPSGQPLNILRNIKPAFYRQLNYLLGHMTEAANGCSRALSNLKAPFLSASMGGIETGIDLRDVNCQGTKYNGSGCLIHGLSVVADSFVAIEDLLENRPDAGELIDALKANFEGYENLRQFLLSAAKYGNNIDRVDDEAYRIVNEVSDRVAAQRNYLGNPFRPDWSTPSTHLLYGYWVGATPDGRQAREMLNYGVDPLYGEAGNGLGFRILSTQKLPFEKMPGGYASHFGIDPTYFPEKRFEEKGVAFYRKVIRPLFFPDSGKINPFYLYVNVTTPDMLRKVMNEPKKYAPSGVYIMRIHGTFVNFLDLSPTIQNDIIFRLDLQSTSI
ncbi:MAG: pyruvate formate lyase family protein [Tannerellaceae bacterium]|jgi:formate C-acetyltransferase|nr:pyruvate formate lyase family protein [Tannerellaceae bacterium]